MSSKKARIDHINILQNVTLQASNSDIREAVVFLEKHENHLTQQRNSLNKENCFNSDFTIADDECKRRLRYTTSMYIFDEEPVFSDSDEEKEYNREILKSHDLIPNELPENVSVQVRCNFTPCEKEIINVIKKCSKFDTENCDEDFKKFILLCKHLDNKYQLPDSQADGVCGDDPTKSSTDHQPEQPPKTSLENSKFCNISAEFLPSRHGSDDFVSESFTFRNDQCTSAIQTLAKENSPKLNNINTLNNIQEKNCVPVRRSLRLWRTTRFNRSGAINNNKVTITTTRLNNAKKSTKKPTKTTSERSVSVHNKRKKVIRRKAKITNVNSNDSSANRTNENLVSSKKSTSLQHTRKVRQLYSPRAWLLSNEFAKLIEAERK